MVKEDKGSMKQPGLSDLGPCYILGPGLFLGLRLLQSQDPHDFIVQPDPSKESGAISQAVKQSSRFGGTSDSLTILLILKRSKS